MLDSEHTGVLGWGSAGSTPTPLYVGSPRALSVQGEHTLCNTAARFFNAEADLLGPAALQEILRSLPPDLAADLGSERLTSLLLGDDTALLAQRPFGPSPPVVLRLQKPRIADSARVFDAFAVAMGVGLAESRRHGFADAARTLGDGLVGLAVAKYIAEGGAAEAAVLHLLHLFSKLRSATFEGEPFTTGLLFVHATEGRAERGGFTPLTRTCPLYRAHDLDKRFWFMVDGRATYYVCNPSLEIRHAFAVPPGSGSTQRWLEQTLGAGEALFRVTSRSEFCVSTPDGFDFSYHNDMWRLRDYRSIYGAVMHRVACSRAFLDALLPFVLRLSNRHMGALLWIPSPEGEDAVHLKTQNRLLAEPVSIFDERRRAFLLRQFASDGATVIGVSGEVLRYGCIVDNGRDALDGMHGTGEVTARHLCRHGVAIKVSRDGQVQIYTVPDAPALLL